MKRCLPAVSDVIEETGDGGHRVTSKEVLAALPMFEWHQIFNMAGAQAPPAKGKK